MVKPLPNPIRMREENARAFARCRALSHEAYLELERIHAARRILGNGPTIRARILELQSINTKDRRP